jgi:hypothetical protein
MHCVTPSFIQTDLKWRVESVQRPPIFLLEASKGFARGRQGGVVRIRVDIRVERCVRARQAGSNVAGGDKPNVLPLRHDSAVPRVAAEIRNCKSPPQWTLSNSDFF